MASFKRSGPWLFFALAYGLTWLFWIPAALSGQARPAPLVLALHYLGGLALPVVTIALTLVTQDQEGRRDYWRRIFEIRRISASWHGVVLLTVPLLTALAVSLDIVLGGHGAEPEAAAQFAARPLAILPFALFMFVFGPLPEEIAWRGYALDRLQARWNALASSLILGIAWTLWHLPLFFIPGTYQHGLEGTASFWLFFVDKIPQSIAMTWVYNNTRRSTLSAIVLHFTINFFGELFNLSARAELVYNMLWIAAAIAIILMWGAKTLVRNRNG